MLDWYFMFQQSNLSWWQAHPTIWAFCLVVFCGLALAYDSAKPLLKALT